MFVIFQEFSLYFSIFCDRLNFSCPSTTLTLIFPAFFTLTSQQFKLVIDSVVWAFKHTERHISETGLSILLEMLNNISVERTEVSSAFYQSYFLSLLQDIFFVLTDSMHKSGENLQRSIRNHIISTIQEKYKNL